MIMSQPPLPWKLTEPEGLSPSIQSKHATAQIADEQGQSSLPGESVENFGTPSTSKYQRPTGHSLIG